ncbi:DtxR family transcriptional regulator [Candidatus Poribacteria bacterium]|nr:DtxR family transcriptional regulator [Candidatus Poribacteria bacterium]
MGNNLTLTNSMEDYLEAISLLDEEMKYVRVRDIAKHMNVSMSSVTGALRTLSKRNLVEHEKYEYVALTPKGEKIAQEIRRRHDAVLKFLTEVLKMDTETAEKDACGMEHAIGSETLERLLKFIECIEDCPKGVPECIIRFQDYVEKGKKPPIAFCTKELTEEDTLSLDMLETGTKAVITKVCGRGPTKRRMMDMGVVPGANVEIERVAPLGDPVEIKIKDYHLSLRKAEASNVFVDKNI